MMKGLISPAEAGLQDVRQLKQLMLRTKLTTHATELMIISAAVLAGLIFMTIPFYKYDTTDHALTFGLPWGLLQGIWTYYCAGGSIR